MSVASLAGYLSNNGGGQQSSYYKAYSQPSVTALTAVNTQTLLLTPGVIIPPAGKYLVNTFIPFQSYDDDGTVAGNITEVGVTVLYENTIINNQTYSSTMSPDSRYFVQTTGIFTSDGVESLSIIVNVLEATGATQYNVLTGGNSSPQVQIVSLSEYKGGGGDGAVNSLTQGLGITIVDQGSGAYLIENAGVISAVGGDGIDVVLDASTGKITITNSAGGGGGIDTVVDGDGITASIAGTTLNIANSGLLSATDGDGITITTTDGVLNIANSGLLSATDGDGISATTANGVLNIANTGLLSATDGVGITTTTTNGVLDIANTGVLSLTAGTNITLSGSNDDITINASNGINYNLAFTQLTFPSQTIQPGIIQNALLFSIPGFIATATTIVVAQNNSTNATVPISVIARYNPSQPGGLILDVANLSDTAITTTFPFSVIAINPV